MSRRVQCACSSFFFNDTATTEIYTLSLHDALPISLLGLQAFGALALDLFLALPALPFELLPQGALGLLGQLQSDRKSTRLNSSHANISYAVFCLKKKNNASRCSFPVSTDQTIQPQF